MASPRFVVPWIRDGNWRLNSQTLETRVGIETMGGQPSCLKAECKQSLTGLCKLKIVIRLAGLARLLVGTLSHGSYWGGRGISK